MKPRDVLDAQRPVREVRSAVCRPITHLNKRYLPHIGGVERVVHSLARAMHREGHAVRAVTCGHGLRQRRTRQDGVDLIELPTIAEIQSLPLAPAFLHFPVRRGEIWHLHEPFPLGTLSVFLRLSRLRQSMTSLVVTWHTDVVRQRMMRPLHYAIARVVLRAADVIHVPTRAHIESSEVINAYREKCEVIPFMVDVQSFARTPERHRAQQIRSWANRCAVALFVGRLVYYKGLDILLEALERVPQLRLVIAGTGPLEKQLRVHASRLGVRDRIWWLGEVPESELAAVYSGADFFVLPSTHRAEAFGLTQVEAMAAGLPVISTRLGTGVDIVNVDGQSGLLVAPGRVPQLADALAILATDGRERERLSEGALQRAQDFSPTRLLPEYRRLYGDLRASHSHVP